jgi:hypothetical protein
MVFYFINDSLNTTRSRNISTHCRLYIAFIDHFAIQIKPSGCTIGTIQEDIINLLNKLICCQVFTATPTETDIKRQ